MGPLGPHVPVAAVGVPLLKTTWDVIGAVVIVSLVLGGLLAFVIKAQQWCVEDCMRTRAFPSAESCQFVCRHSR